MKQKQNALDALVFIHEHKADSVFLGIGVLLGVFFDWNIVEIGIFVFFVAMILGYVSLRTTGFFALFFLAFTPILLLLDRETRAEEFAVYAYYFLVMAVIRGIIEVREQDASKKNKK